MKRLYTLALSAIVLAASATIAVPTAKMARAKALQPQTELTKSGQIKADRSALKSATATSTAEAKTLDIIAHAAPGNVKAIRSVKHNAATTRVNLDEAPAKALLKAPRKAPETIADYSTVYNLSCTNMRTASAPKQLTITVTDETTGAATITGFATLNEGPAAVNATFDLAAGTLTIPNKQLLGTDSDGDIYFYVKGFDDDGYVVDGAADVEATVGTISGSTITFPQFDILAIGDYNNEALGWYFLTYNNRLSIYVPVDPNADPNEGWTSLGQATFMDGWLLPGFKIDQTNSENWYEVELQQNDENPNIYRLVNPYKGNCPVAAKNESTNNGYIQFDVTDPDHVTFANVDAGFAHSGIEYTEFYCNNYLSYYVNAGYDPEYLIDLLGDQIPYTTFKNGVVKVGTMIEDGALTNDAGFGNQDNPNRLIHWQDDEGNPVDMSCAIYFPGASAPVEPEYTVYSNGTVGDGLAVNSWWNATLDTNADNPAGEGKVYSLTHAGTLDGNFCAGMQTADQSTVTGPLHSATLTFEYYATTTCDITVRLTAGKEENKVVTVAESDINKWNTVSFSVADDYPEVAAAWNDWTNQGDGDCVFGIVVEKFNADTKVYFNNVVYTNCDTEWAKPAVEAPFCPTPATPAHAAANVVSLLSGAYTPATGFNVGSWGQSTQYKLLTAENNAPVARLSNYNYLGWELTDHIDISACEYMHVDLYTAAETAFGFTPISAGAEKAYVVAAADVKAGEWNSFDVPLTYFEGVDLTDVFQIKFDQGDGSAEVYVANVYFYKNGGETPGEYTWKSLGQGKYKDAVFADMYSAPSEFIDVEVFEANEKAGVYKFVGIWTDMLEEGGSLIVDASDPTFVDVYAQNTGYVDSVDGITMVKGNATDFAEKYDKEVIKAGAPGIVITMTDGVITFPVESLLLGWPEAPEDSEYQTDPEEWYYANSYTTGIAVLPGAEYVEPDPNEGWTSVGQATLQDGWLLPGIGIDQTNSENWYEVELQQNDENQNVYRLVDPYHGDSPAAPYNGSKSIGYIQFDVTDPEHVTFATDIAAGFANTSAGISVFYCSNIYSVLVEEYAALGVGAEAVMQELGESYQYSTYKDGVVTLPSWPLAEGGYENNACIGISATQTGLCWQDDNELPLNMETKIFFPGSAISELKAADEATEVYYNLRGQRIAKPTVPGIYIRNNAKIMVR